MTTLTRKIRRASARRNAKEWPTSERPWRVSKRGNGYDTLTPTKGWKRISANRLRAQNRLRAIAEWISARRKAA